MKMASGLGAASSRTGPAANPRVQVAPEQAMPGGTEVTVPAPVAVTVSATDDGMAVKCAVTSRLPFTRTMQGVVPAHPPPPHPPKVDVALGDAFSVTVDGLEYVWLQSAGQRMALEPIDSTLPEPLPSRWTVTVP